MRVAGNEHELDVASASLRDSFPLVLIEVNLSHGVGGFDIHLSSPAASSPGQGIVVRFVHFSAAGNGGKIRV
jgi:hypothetical protein